MSAAGAPASVQVPGAQAVPLCVDLDGTLLRTDMLQESLVAAARRAPWILFLVPFWLAGGRARLKRELARRGAVDPALLPYDADVLALVRAERERGRRIVLATASDRAIAERIAAHLGCIDEVMASDGVANMKGANKARALEARFGARGFDYVGDCHADLAIWSVAHAAYVCGRVAPRVLRRLEGTTPVVAVPRARAARWPVLRALRLHQWAKNLLVFVPLVTAHRLSDSGAVQAAFIASVAFSLAASGTYLVNDLADLEHDRRHPSKRRRALAAGDLPLWTGGLLAPVLVALAFALALALPTLFVAELAAYVAITVAYSAWLKRLVLVDVFTLAGLYAVRILAGAAAIAVPVSHWLMVFSLFMFLSLALAKRYTELAGLARREGGAAPGRGYRIEDRALVGFLGVASGQLSVLVFALYITSPEVRTLYAQPGFLWLVCPILLYWVARVWLLAYREQLHDDPLVFALRDRASYLLGAATLAVLVLAT